jgi:hypothetical protein
LCSKNQRYAKWRRRLEIWRLPAAAKARPGEPERALIAEPDGSTLNYFRYTAKMID